MSDLISRQAAISAICNACGKIDCDKMDKCEKLQLPSANCSEFPNNSDTISRQAVKDILDKYQLRYHIFPYVWDAINELPPALPEPSQVAKDIARIVENGKDMRVIEAAQPTPDQNGDLWITVPDIDKVTRIYVQESKSKFCRIFYEEQPERIKGHWIESAGQNILLKKLIEKGETWRVCDKCGAGFMIGYQYECDKAYHETFHNFCPKCGADMRGEQGWIDTTRIQINF